MPALGGRSGGGVRRGILITFEGPEGSGKSTHIRGLAGWLRQRGRRVLVTHEPGGTKWARTLRQFLLHTQTAISPLGELLLYEADRVLHVAEVIAPALRRGQVVLCDRYTDSTLAYQGYGRGLQRGLIQSLNRIASAGYKPDLTILLDVPAERGLRQAIAKKGGKDRLEMAGLAFHRRVRRGFLKLAAREPRRFRVIPQQPRPAVTQRLIQQVVERFFQRYP